MIIKSEEVLPFPIGSNYRSQIDKVLVSPPNSLSPDQRCFWVCQSQAAVFIPAGINGEIREMIPLYSIDEHHSFGVPHLYSLLIPGGATNWKIRFEIFCSLNERPKELMLDVFQDSV